MRRLATILCAFLGILPLVASVTSLGSVPAQAMSAYEAYKNLPGLYRVEGRNPDGSPYQGRVRIKTDKGVILIRWDIGNQTYHGKGKFNGEMLVVDWGQADPVIYQVNRNGTLVGSWAAGQASERLTKLR